MIIVIWYILGLITSYVLYKKSKTDEDFKAFFLISVVFPPLTFLIMPLFAVLVGFGWLFYNGFKYIFQYLDYLIEKIKS